MWVSLERTFTFDLDPDQHTVHFLCGPQRAKKTSKYLNSSNAMFCYSLLPSFNTFFFYFNQKLIRNSCIIFVHEMIFFSPYQVSFTSPYPKPLPRTDEEGILTSIRIWLTKPTANRLAYHLPLGASLFSKVPRGRHISSSSQTEKNGLRSAPEETICFTLYSFFFTTSSRRKVVNQDVLTQAFRESTCCG